MTMNEIESIVTEIIQGVKQSGKFRDIRFINAYNNQPAEKPVEGYLAVVEMAGFDERIKLNVRLIGGNDVSGSQLGYTAVELAAALKNSAENAESVSLSETKYDKNITAFYRDINLLISLNDGEIDDGDSVTVYIGSDILGDVTSFKCEEKTEETGLYEYHRGAPYAVINSRHYYDITLEVKSLSLLSFENGFTLRIENGDGVLSFLSCVIGKVLTSVNAKGQIVYTVKIISESKVIS